MGHGVTTDSLLRPGDGAADAGDAGKATVTYRNRLIVTSAAVCSPQVVAWCWAAGLVAGGWGGEVEGKVVPFTRHDGM